MVLPGVPANKKLVHDPDYIQGLGYAIVARNKTPIATNVYPTLSQLQYPYGIIKSDWPEMPDLHELFLGGGTLNLRVNEPGTTYRLGSLTDASDPTTADDNHKRNGRQVIINEVMWAHDDSQSRTSDALLREQWIELYNTTTRPIKLSDIEFITSKEFPGPDPETDMLSNIPSYDNTWELGDKGQHGRSTEPIREFKSMERVNYDNGWEAKQWRIATVPYFRNYRGTPGQENREAQEAMGPVDTTPTPPDEGRTPIETPPDEGRTPIETTNKAVFSEVMLESEGGDDGLPQWLEVYNNSTASINLRGWKLQWRQLKPDFLNVTATFQDDFIIPSKQCRLIVSAFGRHSKRGKLSNEDVYLLSRILAGEFALDANQPGIPEVPHHFISQVFSLKLLDPNDDIVDQIGTLNGNEETWKLPEGLIEGVRSSLIRRFDKDVPRSGIEKRGWIRAFDAKKLIPGSYYGRSTDFGTPGFRGGKPLPVELSQFSARFVNDAVVINWTTESELNNAGFNILRSTSRIKNFHPINTKLIRGAGTTAERNTYQFIDRTAKPNVAYYYRLEDVDLSGTRGISTTSRLRGIITPTGKHITAWGKLKYNN